MRTFAESATQERPTDDPAIIGRATAILMRRFGVDELRAHKLLHRIAKRGGTSVEALASRVLATNAAASAWWR
jgi:AmiR/NasT family two-component response regulator